MQWPEDLADELPAPREDEPESLRQDIADELADHLECAFVRELHQTRDESTARNNALDRFGNPSQVARKLWLDAMWERIMSQRILVAALAIMGLASLASTGLMWKQMERSQELQQAMLAESRTATAALLEQTQAANRELAVQARESNAALLAKLGELASTARSPAASPASLEWNPVKVRLYSGEKPGVPAPNFKVTLRGYVLDTAKEVSIARQSDETGVVDLGLIRPGQHTLDVVSPWGETHRQRHITVLPGQPLLIEIASPAAQREPATVIFHPDLPSEFKERDCWLLAHFAAEPRISGGAAWTPETDQSQYAAVIPPGGQARWLPLDNKSSSERVREYPFMLAKRESETSGVLRLEHRQQWSQEIISKELGGDGVTPRQVQTGLASRFSLILPDTDTHENLSFPEGKYRLNSILLAAPPAEFDAKKTNAMTQEAFEIRNRPGSTWRGFELPILAGYAIQNRPQVTISREGMIPISFRPITGWFEPDAAPDPTKRANSRDAQGPELPLFEARPHELNHWRLALPEPLLQRARKNPVWTEKADPAENKSGS